MRSFGKVLAGKSCTARQALDVAPNVTSKLMFRRSIQTILSLVSGQKYSFNFRLHFLNRDYPLPLSSGTVFSATIENLRKFFCSIGHFISVRRLSEMKCPMEQEISGISKFLEKRTSSGGFPKIYEKNISAISVVFHLILCRRFRKFCLNGSRPSFRVFCYS